MQPLTSSQSAAVAATDVCNCVNLVSLRHLQLAQEIAHNNAGSPTMLWCIVNAPIALHILLCSYFLVLSMKVHYCWTVVHNGSQHTDHITEFLGMSISYDDAA